MESGGVAGGAPAPAQPPAPVAAVEKSAASMTAKVGLRGIAPEHVHSSTESGVLARNSCRSRNESFGATPSVRLPSAVQTNAEFVAR